MYADDAKIYNHMLINKDKDVIQNDLSKLKNCADNWLIYLNVDKCKKVSYGRHIDIANKYSTANTVLKTVNSIKDLGLLLINT
jgi:hypothetical protein